MNSKMSELTEEERNIVIKERKLANIGYKDLKTKEKQIECLESIIERKKDPYGYASKWAERNLNELKKGK